MTTTTSPPCFQSGRDQATPDDSKAPSLSRVIPPLRSSTTNLIETGKTSSKSTLRMMCSQTNLFQTTNTYQAIILTKNPSIRKSHSR